MPAYLPADQAQYTPVLDDRTGRTDQVSFGVRGIPSLGDIGQYDSSTDPLVGGNDNPYPNYYPSKPTLSGEFGQDSSSDYFSNLNYWASGTVHGPGGFDKPSEGPAARRRVHRDVVLVRDRLAAGGRRGRPAEPPDRLLRDDAEEADRADDRHLRRRLQPDEERRARTASTYYWDFGDGSPMVMTDNPLIQHTFPTQAAWRDVKLLVAGAGQWNDPSKCGSFRQVEPIDFFPTYYPALAPPTEPAAPTTGSAADPCGALTADEQTALIAEARDAKHAAGDDADALGHRELGTHQRRLEARRHRDAVTA